MRLTTLGATALFTLAGLAGAAAGTNHWHVSTYYAANLNDHGPGNRAMWCGDSTLVACAAWDSVGGVAHGMFDDLVWVRAVGDPGDSVTVRVTAWINYDVRDETWDWLELFVARGDQEELLAAYTGSADNLFIDHETVVRPGDYTGTASDEVALTFRVRSDAAWDDADCFVPSHGAAQLDDITVRFDGTAVTFDDFEADSPVAWQPAPDPLSGVGDAPAAAAVLVQASPNPFNPRTAVVFAARAGAPVTVSVYNVQGQRVATLYDGLARGGRQSVVWEPRRLASGIYLVRAVSEGAAAVEKVALLE